MFERFCFQDFTVHLVVVVETLQKVLLNKRKDELFDNQV